MFRLLKNVMHVGIGGAAIAADKVQEGIQELIKKGQITEQEGIELLDGYLSRMKVEGEKLKEQIDSAVKEQLEKVALPSKAEVDALKNEVTLLKARVATLESASKE